MWNYEKRLQYPVNIKNSNAKAARFIITQFGGPDGELAASMRYLSQRYTMPYKEVCGVLTDIGSEVPVLSRRGYKPAWGQDSGHPIDSMGIEVSKLHFSFAGRKDKRKCEVIPMMDKEKTTARPVLSGKWINIMLIFCTEHIEPDIGTSVSR